jgi:hypothetical protein
MHGLPYMSISTLFFFSGDEISGQWGVDIKSLSSRFVVNIHTCLYIFSGFLNESVVLIIIF